MAILLAVALLVVVLIWIGQRRLIYFPFGGAPDLPESGLTTAETVSFSTEDGLTLHAWFVRATTEPTGQTLIVFNGNAGHRGYRAVLARALAARGLACLLLDYRGYGGNPGSPSEIGLTRDARAARSYLAGRTGVDARRLVYFGESLGAAVAVRLASEHPPEALVLRSPFTSLADIGRRHYPWLPVRWILRDRYPAADLMAHVRAPVLVIAGTADGIIPFDNSVQFFNAAPQPKQMITIEGADHNDEALVHGEAMADAVARFLRGVPAAGTFR